MARLARSPESSAPRTTNILDAACGDFCHCGRRKCCHRLGLDNSSLNPKRSGADSSSVMSRQRKTAHASGGRGPLGPLPGLVRAGTIAVQLRSLASISSAGHFSAETCATSQPLAGDRSRFLAAPALVLGERIQSRLLFIVQHAVEFVERRLHDCHRRNHRLDALLHGR